MAIGRDTYGLLNYVNTGGLTYDTGDRLTKDRVDAILWDLLDIPNVGFQHTQDGLDQIFHGGPLGSIDTGGSCELLAFGPTLVVPHSSVWLVKGIVYLEVSLSIELLTPADYYVYLKWDGETSNLVALETATRPTDFPAICIAKVTSTGTELTIDQTDVAVDVVSLAEGVSVSGAGITLDDTNWDVLLSGVAADPNSAFDALDDHDHTRPVGWLASNDGSDVAIATGIQGIIIPPEYDGWEITSVAVAVSVASVGTGTTDIQIQKMRTGSKQAVLSTQVTLAEGEYYAADGVIDTSYDTVLAGDILFYDITAAGGSTSKAQGLAVTVGLSPA